MAVVGGGSFLESLEEHASILNRKCNQFQEDAKSLFDRAMKSKADELNTKMFNEEMNKLCDYYLFSIKALQTQHLEKFKSKLNGDNPHQSEKKVDETRISLQQSSNLKNTNHTITSTNQSDGDNETEKPYKCIESRHIRKRHNQNTTISDDDETVNDFTNSINSSSINGSNDDKSNSPESIKLTTNNDSDERPHSCDQCDKSFKHLRNLTSHLRDVHNYFPYPCDQCHQAFKYASQLWQHKDSEHNNNIIGFTTHSTTSISATSTQNENPFECDICNKTFPTKIGLGSHKGQVHRGQVHRARPHKVGKKKQTREYECNYDDDCNRSFKRRCDLYIHIRNDHDGYPFQCNQCKQQFKYQKELKKHEKKNNCCAVHSQKQSEDEYDEEDFDDDYDDEYQDYQNDVESEEDVDSLQCDICGKQCANPRTLRNHKLLHSSKRPFKCPYCSSGFVIEDRWAKHLLRYHDKDPFKCYKCDKQFRRKTSLKQHQSAEHRSSYYDEDKLEQCDDCDILLTATELIKHKKWFHGYQTSNDCTVKSESGNTDMVNYWGREKDDYQKMSLMIVIEIMMMMMIMILI